MSSHAHRFLGRHVGGYSEFSFELTKLKAKDNELIVAVYDPSELGGQPFGKQRAKSIAQPGTHGEKYTPTSGIWQTVWLEPVPTNFVSALHLDANMTHLSVEAKVDLLSASPRASAEVIFVVESAPGKVLASAKAPLLADTAMATLRVPQPQLWTPASPFLYNISVHFEAAGAVDTVRSYFGMRQVSLGSTKDGRKSLFLNGKAFFASGWLDQSWWPDGQYTAPTDAALAFDIEATKTFGMNMIRLHQKINPQRWYYHADRVGVLVFQDAVQHFRYPGGEDTNTTLFVQDWSAAILGRKNHPCIVQWDIFNEFEFQPSE